MFTTENEETQPHVNPESRRYLERIKERLFRQVASVIRTRARPIGASFTLFASNVANPQRLLRLERSFDSSDSPSLWIAVAIRARTWDTRVHFQPA